MTVIMKGGTSGCEHDYLPPEVGHQPQPVLDTSTRGKPDADVFLASEHSKSTHPGWNTATPDIPSGCEHRSLDLEPPKEADTGEQDIRSATFGQRDFPKQIQGGDIGAGNRG